MSNVGFLLSGGPAAEAAGGAPLAVADLLDIAELRALCESFSVITGTVIALLDVDGNILIATGWQEICTRFHRQNPETACRCRQSDTVLANQLAGDEDYHVYRCENGMVDVAMPVTVAGVHVANLYTGQFFFEPPDERYFIRQAARYGFDEAAYLAALRKVAIVPEDRARRTMEYLASLARLFGETGRARKNLEEANRLLTQQVDDNRRTLDALQVSEEKFRGMAENIPGVVYRMHVRAGGATYFSYFSPHARDLFGQPVPADSTYEQLCELMHADDRARFRESITRAIDARGPWDSEGRLVAADGSVKWIRGVSSPSRIGEEMVYDGVLLDITEQKRLEDRLLQAQKMESVGFLAGGIAHDLNNLLTPILGYAEMVKGIVGPASEAAAAIGQLALAAQRARDLTQRLLGFSHKQTIMLRVIRLSDVVRSFMGMLRRTIRDDIGMEVRADPPTGPVRADPVQVEQILLNLAVNAQDAMPRGGTLSIEVRDVELDGRTPDGPAEAPPGPYTLLAVADSGAGMDEEVRRHIFEPFYTTKDVGKGTGLGLSTVYGIVKRHGAAVTVRSERGVGSVFTVYFPRAAETAQPLQRPAQTAPAAQTARGPETVLVIDDNELVAGVTRAMLEGLGYTVLLASTAEQCTELARGYPQEIQLLLTDVVMPSVNGRELYERLHPLRPRMRVLYMSGYTDDEIGKHGVLDEKTLLVVKPFTVTELAAMVRRALD